MFRLAPANPHKKSRCHASNAAHTIRGEEFIVSVQRNFEDFSLGVLVLTLPLHAVPTMQLKCRMLGRARINFEVANYPPDSRFPAATNSLVRAQDQRAAVSN
jgi:hypothetical protein